MEYLAKNLTFPLVSQGKNETPWDFCGKPAKIR